MSFLYFLPAPPEKQSLSHDDIIAAGIGYAAEGGRGFTAIATSAGPDGKTGLLVGFVNDDGTEPRLQYHPDQQTWRSNHDGKFWVGLNDNREKPRPSDLARKKFIGGEPVKLRDGQDWVIPICRSIVRGSTLPKALALGPDNKTWRLQDLPEFLKLCADAETVWNAFQQAVVSQTGSIAIDAQEAPRIAADAMAVNYRVGPLEISLLELWATTDMWSILRVVIDANAVDRMAKAAAEKNRQAGAA